MDMPEKISIYNSSSFSEELSFIDDKEGNMIDKIADADLYLSNTKSTALDSEDEELSNLISFLKPSPLTDLSNQQEEVSKDKNEIKSFSLSSNQRCSKRINMTGRVLVSSVSSCLLENKRNQTSNIKRIGCIFK
jgi:hypothetical protein